jgi:hypothetical protein
LKGWLLLLVLKLLLLFVATPWLFVGVLDDLLHPGTLTGQTSMA